MTMNPLSTALRETSTTSDNPVNNLQDVENLKVVVWTYPKTGTTSLAEAFQRSIDGTTQFKNVTHSHIVNCWKTWHPAVINKLKPLKFSFTMLVEFINSFNIKPLIVQSFRDPYKLTLSYYHAIGQHHAIPVVPILPCSKIPSLFQCTFDKDNGFGFQIGDKYDILYTTVESLSNLPRNIKTIDCLSDYHNLTIERKNVAHGKDRVQYEEFKKSYKWSSEQVAAIHKHYKQQLEFYYTQDQIEQMKKQALNE